MSRTARALTLAGHIARWFRRLFEAAATLGFAAMIGLIVWTVWQRYVVGVPSRWSDELAMILFLWTIFGAAALVVPYRSQIAVGLAFDSTPERVQRWLTVVGAGAAGLILLATLPVTLDYIAFLWRERAPALRWRLNHVYLIFGLFQGGVALSLILRALLALFGRPSALDDATLPETRDTQP